jgi:hypothetical protein
MIDDLATLSVPIRADIAPARASTIAQLAAIPEEEIWLAKQKSAHPPGLSARRSAFHAHADDHFARGVAPGPVGWVERSETHQGPGWRSMSFAALNPSYLGKISPSPSKYFWISGGSGPTKSSATMVIPRRFWLWRCRVGRRGASLA